MITNSRRLGRRSAVLSLCAAICAVAVMPQAALAATSRPDLSGYWILKSDPLKVAPAQSTPAAARTAKALLAAKGLDAPNGSPAYLENWCTAAGVPWQMSMNQPIDIRQGPLSVSMTFAGAWDARNIYIDGQEHPPLDDFEYTTVGHSIGRWDGQTLVADTVGFEGGVTYIPGDALRTKDSRLVERFRLLTPDQLEVVSTWTDRTSLRRPHSYTLIYERAPSPFWMPEPNCNPIPNMRAKGLPLPADAPR